MSSNRRVVLTTRNYNNLQQELRVYKSSCSCLENKVTKLVAEVLSLSLKNAQLKEDINNLNSALDLLDI